MTSRVQQQVAEWGEWFELERSMHNRSVLAPAWVAELLNLESFLGLQRPPDVLRWDTLPNPIPGLDDNLAPTAAETQIVQTQLQASLRLARAYFALPTGGNPEFLKAYQTLQTKRDKARQRIVVGRVTPAQRAQARMRVAGVDDIDDMEVGKFVVTFMPANRSVAWNSKYGPLFCLGRVKRIIPLEERELQTVRDGPRNPNFRPDVFEVRFARKFAFLTVMFSLY